jgi:hypothetical protein
VGSPIFDKVTINLENGKKFEIIAKNNSAANKYILSAELNGQPWAKSYLNHADIANGGQAVFRMGSEPNREWGAKKEDRPQSPGKLFRFAKVPVIEFGDILFLDERAVTLTASEPGSKIYYTLDGSEPGEKSSPYLEPLKITKPAVLRVRSFVDGLLPGYPVSIQFKKIEMLEAVEASGLKPGVRYIYREGPGVQSARNQEGPVLDTGILSTFNVDAIKDQRSFGYQLNGYLKVPDTGVYTFSLEANDGAILYLNGKLIIDNDGGHRAQVLDSKIGLKMGWHPIKVDYFQQGLAKSLKVKWEGPGVENREVQADDLFTTEN